MHTGLVCLFFPDPKWWWENPREESQGREKQRESGEGEQRLHPIVQREYREWDRVISLLQGEAGRARWTCYGIA